VRCSALTWPRDCEYARMRGAVDPEMRVLAEAFRAVTADGHPAALSASRAGRRLLDVSAGADRTGRPFTSGTPVFLYSAVKPVAAAALLTAVAHGAVDLDARVAALWPTFGAHGKGRVTVREALGHGAAVPGWREPIDLGTLADLPAAAERLARSEPWWTPGEPGEHAVSYGHLLDGILRAGTGRGIAAWWAELHAAGCTGVALHPPADVAPLEDPGGRFRATWTAAEGPMGALLRNPVALLDAAVVNSPACRGLVAPAVTGYASARGLDDLWSWWTGPGAAAAWGSALRDASLTPQVSGRDHVLGREVAWGLGPQVDEAFVGMGGVGGCFGGHDRRLDLTIGCTTPRLGPLDRFDPIDEALDRMAGD
jgi:CubicO group peptidase (beta-lactamase class C family)